jgi:hypothetical protein
MAEIISIREFSRRVKVSDTAIRKAITAGHIVAGKVVDNGMPKISYELAKQEWDIYQSQQGKAITQAVTKPKPTPSTQTVRQAAPPPAPAPVVQAEAPKPQAGTLAAARLIKEQLNAKLLQMEVGVKMGKLVDRDTVYSNLFAAGQEIRINFLTLPDRHIDDIWGAASRNEAHTILVDAIAEVLKEVAELGKMDITKSKR